MTSTSAPRVLQVWFIIHFIIDIIVAIPLLIAPVYFLNLVGWQQIDIISIRLVAAALFSIGIESLVGRHASRESFKTMLRLKIIWSFMAVVGIGWSLIELSGVSWLVYLILITFLFFNVVWWFWYIRLR